jgi:hypothetical protein
MITNEDSSGTSKHGKWFEGSRRSVYKERFFGIGGFPILLSLLVLLYGKQKYDFGKTSPLLSLFLSLDTHVALSPATFLSPAPDPARYHNEVGTTPA